MQLYGTQALAQQQWQIVQATSKTDYAVDYVLCKDWRKSMNLSMTATVINPRYACTARVTVLGSCVCVCVCVCVCPLHFSHYE